MNNQRTHITLYFLILAISISTAISAQTLSRDLLPVKVNKEFGYINKQGEMVIEPQFNFAARFEEGLAVIRQGDDEWGTGGKYGYIDSTGRIIVHPVFDVAGNFCNGWARVKEKGKAFIYLDKMGRLAIAKKFHQCYALQKELPIPVRENRTVKGGYIDKKGIYVIPPKFDMVRPFKDGLAVAGIDRSQGFINKQGEFIIEPRFYRANYFSDGLARVTIKDQRTKDKREGYIDKAGRFIIPPTFKMGFASDFSNGLAAVCTDGKRWGYINAKGIMVIPPKYETAGPFKDGLARVRINGKYGFINQKGKIVIKPKFAKASNFQNDVASVFLKNERMAYINRLGKYIWKSPKPPKPKKEEGYFDDDF